MCETTFISLGFMCVCCVQIPLETHRSFIADSTLHHMLVDLAFHRDEALTHPTADNRGTAALWGSERGVGWRILP